MIHEGVLKLTETHFGGHPCCIVSISYELCGPFHGGNEAALQDDRCACLPVYLGNPVEGERDSGVKPNSIPV
jgi:hypothetical protein